MAGSIIRTGINRQIHVISACAILAAATLNAVTVDLEPDAAVSVGTFTTAVFEGRTVWVPDNESIQLLFDVPESFTFAPGQPVYVRIEYHDSGRGYLFAEYDSVNLINEDCEVHSRSSRVGTGRYVFNYQLCEFPQFDGRQPGGNDFRFKLRSTDGTPLRIASVQVSTEPYPDEDFQYALSRPWLHPYSGPVRDFVDRHTVSGKVMTGYQGWFAAPNDPRDAGWKHWGRSTYVDPSPTEITVDMWPWLNEYNPDDLYPAGEMILGDGRPAHVFSSNDPETVQRHFRWMRRYDIDGVYLQRFVNRNNSGYYGATEFVLNNVREAASKEGRVWAIEYDVSSLDGEADPFTVMTSDWLYLVNNLGILEDPRYLYQDGKPVLFIWGFSVEGRNFTREQADQVVDWFRARDLYLIGGINWYWENNVDWYDHYKKYDEILGWQLRDLSRMQHQQATLAGWGVKLLPHAWPGFSWANLKMLQPSEQYTPREGGAFYWNRLKEALSIGADQIFLGMFDEYDEGTAIMPMADNHPDPHTEWGAYIDNEGRNPFWWLHLSGAAGEILSGLRTITATMPEELDLTPPAYGGADASIYLGNSDLNEGLTHVQPGDGETYSSNIASQNCRINSGGYFYFAIDDAFCSNVEAGQSATVEIEFYDNYPGTTIRLQYDAVDNPYRTHSRAIDPADSPGWKNIRWNVGDALFGNRQNGGSDFRIHVLGGETAIRRVSVFLPEEKEGLIQEDDPVIRHAESFISWPEKYDWIGWRLFESSTLSGNDWLIVPGPYQSEEGSIQFNPSDDKFYQLRRPVRK